MTFLAAKLQGSLSELSQIIAAKTIKKNPYCSQTVTFKLSLALVMTFLVAENKKWQLEDFPQANFGHLPADFFSR